MKELRFLSLATAATLALVSHQPASANPTQITNVTVNPSGSGFDVVLQTQGGKPPQVFNVNRGNTWNAYVFNAQIAQPYRQSNPAPGISQISVVPTGDNGVQVSVVGTNGAPIGQVASRNAQGVIFNVAGAGAASAAVPVNVPPTGSKMSQAARSAALPNTVAQALPNSTTPVAPFVPTTQVQPNQGQPAVPVAPVPSLQRRAIAPPVGDQAVSQIDTSPTLVDLGTNERIPRLVLRDAPVREVLSLLARAANLNLAYSEPPAGQAGGGAQGAGAQATANGPTISLDIQNESVQDVFNYVLRVACIPVTSGGGTGSTGGSCAALDVNRVGRTIFVGPRLPDDARNIVSRTIRLNQISVADAASFLTTQGAETQRPFEQIQIQTVGEGAAARTIETRTPTILSLRATEGTAPLILRGLAVASNDRLNSITLTGSPRKVEIATRLLGQLDARKRQVAINVKIVDLNLLRTDDLNTSFSFGVGDSFFSVNGGAAVFNFGSNQGATPVSNRFLARLQAQVTSGNGKVLADPTVVIQDGQRSTIRLTQEVFSGFKQVSQSTSTSSGSQSTSSREPIIREAGLKLDIVVNQIDDNGFITLGVLPEISAPGATVPTPDGLITLVQGRRLDSGAIRLRDGQTLVLSGIIQESDRSSVTKVPILGDIPLLGSLFRSTNRVNQRQEVIVMLTPQILDDTDQSNFGYGYVPGKEVRQFLQQQERR